MATEWLKWILIVSAGLSLPGGESTKAGELADRLENKEPAKRRSAVTGLAKIGDRESWKLVVGALSDGAEQVADQAQLALGALDDEVALRALLGKRGLRSKEVGVRRRAAEALGRVSIAVSGTDLLRGLGDRDEEVRRRVLWSIERLAERERLEGQSEGDGEVERRVLPAVRRKWGGSRSAGIRAASLMAIDAIDSREALELAAEGLEDRRVEVRAASLLVTAKHTELAEELGRKLELDPSARVRSLLIESYEALGNREAARALVRILAGDARIRLRWSALGALRRMSGLKYRMKIEPWRAWAEKLPSRWRAASKPAEETPSGASRVFGGMPLLSDRIAFLFDLSGSLWNKRADGTTRKEYADQQLKLALGSLAEDARFNIIPYTKRAFPWSDELQPANERNLTRAYQDFENCTESGQGNFYEAALLALTDPEVDTIMVLTDGAPTGGEIWSLELMMPMLLSQTRFNRVRFDAILVDAPNGLIRHWRDLAVGSGGQVIVVEADSR